MRKLTRRQLIKASGSGLAALSLARSNWAMAKPIIHPKILLIYCSGGWDPTMVFDNKIGVKTIRQESGQLAATAKVKTTSLAYVDHPDRGAVKSFFNAYADRCVFINGLFVEGASHEEQERNLLTHPDPYHPSDNVDWLTFYASQGQTLSYPHILIDMPYFGSRYSSIATSLTSSDITDFVNTPSSTQLTTMQKNFLNDYLSTRYNRFLGNISETSGDFSQLANLRAHLLKNSSLGSTVATQAKALKSETNSFVHNAKFAVNLFKNNISQCVSLRYGAPLAWDSHKDHYATQSDAFAGLFAGLVKIFAYAKALKVLDDMTVIVASEMGRSPYLNSDQGTDHWSTTSMMVCGPGLRGGSIIGVSDDWLRAQAIDPFFGETSVTGTLPSPDLIFMTLYSKYGTPYSLLLPDDMTPLSPMLAVS